ncbi:MAG: hypothetical protein HY200_09425 [Nitrospirae bacterium]|nr:hypothetical protein [Bacteroidota bacterium]MBI3595164.1 hypothetical protein [Nitrospirota bacterium]
MTKQIKNRMLTQLDAVKLVCKYLEERGFLVTHSPLIDKRVNNIRATLKGTQDVVIEVRGNTTVPRVRTSTPSRPYGSEQIKKHVEHVLYQATQNVCGKNLAGIAFSKNMFYQKWVTPILPALKNIGIEIFWILPDGHIEILGYWKNNLIQGEGKFSPK